MTAVRKIRSFFSLQLKRPSWAHPILSGPSRFTLTFDMEGEGDHRSLRVRLYDGDDIVAFHDLSKLDFLSQLATLK